MSNGFCHALYLNQPLLPSNWNVVSMCYWPVSYFIITSILNGGFCLQDQQVLGLRHMLSPWRLERSVCPFQLFPIDHIYLFFTFLFCTWSLLIFGCKCNHFYILAAVLLYVNDCTCIVRCFFLLLRHLNFNMDAVINVGVVEFLYFM